MARFERDLIELAADPRARMRRRSTRVAFSLGPAILAGIRTVVR
jgi:hypothetical protein